MGQFWECEECRYCLQWYERGSVVVIDLQNPFQLCAVDHIVIKIQGESM